MVKSSESSESSLAVDSNTGLAIRSVIAFIWGTSLQLRQEEEFWESVVEKIEANPDPMWKTQDGLNPLSELGSASESAPCGTLWSQFFFCFRSSCYGRSCPVAIQLACIATGIARASIKTAIKVCKARVGGNSASSRLLRLPSVPASAIHGG